MKREIISVLILFLLTTLISCNRNPLKVDISEIEAEPEYVNFSNELFSLPLKDTWPPGRSEKSRSRGNSNKGNWHIECLIPQSVIAGSSVPSVSG